MEKYGEHIAERGSLALYHDPGDDRNPETYTVCLVETPHTCASLEVARDFYELDGGSYRLNGSQVQTVKMWSAEFL